MDEKRKKILVAERMVILQAFADSYLRLTKGKTFAEIYPNVEDKYGRLNKEQELILHDYLVSVYKNFDLDLDTVLKEKGAKVQPGNQLTDFEMEMLVRLADEVIILDGTIIDRKKKLYNNKNKKK